MPLLYTKVCSFMELSNILSWETCWTFVTLFAELTGKCHFLHPSTSCGTTAHSRHVMAFCGKTLCPSRTTKNENEVRNHWLLSFKVCLPKRLPGGLLQFHSSAVVSSKWHVSSTEPGYLYQYSDELRDGLPGFDSRQWQETFLISITSRPALGPTKPPIQ
jgi:hypothetical protein